MNENDNIRLKGKLNTYLKWPMFGTFFGVLATAAVFPVDALAGMIVIGVSIAYFITSLLIYLRFKKNVRKHLVSFGAEYSQIQKGMIKNLDVPYSLLDETGRVLWSNNKMNEILPQAVEENINVISYFPNMENIMDFGEDDTNTAEIKIGEKVYKAVLRPFTFKEAMEHSRVAHSNAKIDMVGMYLYDITDIKIAQKQYKDEKIVAAHVYIDNYDEVLQSIEPARRTLTVALIDRKIAQYFGTYDGVVRKVDNDKFFVIIKSKFISQLQTDKFSVLDGVRDITTGSSMNATISMGLGMGSDTLAGNVELATMAIDLALGRGGDQAVLRDGNKVYYYGGKSKSVEKNTKVKSRVKATAFRELLLDKEQVYVMGHHIADNDAFGAAVGFYRIAKTLGKKAHIVLGEYTNSVTPLVKYFQDSDEYEDDMFVSGSKALDQITKNDILVVVDCSSVAYSEEPKLVNRAQSKVVVDHHRQKEDVIDDANLTYIEPGASSTCEIVAEIMQYTNEAVRLTAKEAESMYAGIYVDTNNFSRRVGSRTFEAAAYLRRKGADITSINMLFRNNIEDYKAKADAISNTEIFKDRFAISICDAKNVESPTVVGAQVANELLTVKGVKGSFVMTPHGDKVYISARSVDNINVQIIMEEFGGGGHMTLAGAQVVSDDVKEVEKELKKLLSEKIKSGDL